MASQPFNADPLTGDLASLTLSHGSQCPSPPGREPEHPLSVHVSENLSFHPSYLHDANAQLRPDGRPVVPGCPNDFPLMDYQFLLLLETLNDDRRERNPRYFLDVPGHWHYRTAEEMYVLIGKLQECDEKARIEEQRLMDIDARKGKSRVVGPKSLPKAQNGVNHVERLLLDDFDFDEFLIDSSSLRPPTPPAEADDGITIHFRTDEKNESLSFGGLGASRPTLPGHETFCFDDSLLDSFDFDKFLMQD